MRAPHPERVLELIALPDEGDTNARSVAFLRFLLLHLTVRDAIRFAMTELKRLSNRYRYATLTKLHGATAGAANFGGRNLFLDLELEQHGADLARLRPLTRADIGYVTTTVELLVDELPGTVPVLAFAGAPFTVASYLIEGRPSRDYVNTKAMMFAAEPLWHALCDRLADMAITSLRSQIDNGASAIQLFDSWAGSLSPAQYERYVFPHSRKVLDAIADTGVPRIHFGVTTGELLPQIGAVGADVVGVDWRVPLDAARDRVGGGKALQGNLDPTVAFAGVDHACEATREVLRRNDGHPGHVFNLGHGVMPSTDPDVLTEVVKVVHAEGTVRS